MFSVFSGLAGYAFMSLFTYRTNGSTVATPVWFAEDDGVIYMTSLADAEEVKHILHNPNVGVAPSTAKGQVLGTTQSAVAKLLSGTQRQIAFDALLQKYGQQFLDMTKQQAGAERVYICITLA